MTIADNDTRPRMPLAQPTGVRAFADTVASGAAHAWKNRPRDNSRVTTVNRETGRVYRDPGLGGVIAAFLILMALSGIAGLAVFALTS